MGWGGGVASWVGGRAGWGFPGWAGRPERTLQRGTSGQGVGLAVSTGRPLLASQWYSVQLSTRLLTQVSLG